jgi:hypothetical protein
MRYISQAVATQPTVSRSPGASQQQTTGRPLIDVRALDRGELVAVAGGALLALSVFLAWFTLGNGLTHLNVCKGPSASCTGWQAMTILRYWLLAAAVAPIILAWIIARGHALSWPRGEMTAVIAIAALTFIVFRGLIDRPGSPSGEIGIDYGWFVALLGGLLILVGSVWRARESGPRRKPPGIL